MADLFESAVLKAPVERVWDVVRDYNAIFVWHPMIRSSRLEGIGVGSVRHITFNDGKAASERLLALADDECLLRYAFIDSPMAVTDYRAAMALFPVTATGETFLVWSGSYDDTNLARRRENEAVFREIFRSGLEGLARHCEEKR